MILWIPGLVAAASAGCTTGTAGRPPAPAPLVFDSGSAKPPGPAAPGAAAGPGATLAAESTPPSPPPKPEPRVPVPPPDPAAIAIVDAVVSRLPAKRPTDDAGTTWISVAPLRNQSHAGAAEFRLFTRRFARLLSEAGRADSIRFTSDPDEARAEVGFELAGTAYLVTAGGFDQWELFLQLRSVGDAWTLWQSDTPAYVLRSARPGLPEMSGPGTNSRR